MSESLFENPASAAEWVRRVLVSRVMEAVPLCRWRDCSSEIRDSASITDEAGARRAAKAVERLIWALTDALNSVDRESLSELDRLLQMRSTLAMVVATLAAAWETPPAGEEDRIDAAELAVLAARLAMAAGVEGNEIASVAMSSPNDGVAIDSVGEVRGESPSAFLSHPSGKM